MPAGGDWAACLPLQASGIRIPFLNNHTFYNSYSQEPLMFRPHAKLAYASALLILLTVTGCGGGGPVADGGGDGNGDGGGSGEVKRMILLTNGDDPFWDAMFAGMKKANDELKLEEDGYVAEMDKNDGTAKGQVDKLKQYSLQTDIKAVAISVTAAKNVAIANAMKSLQEAGIVVITVDSDVDRSKYRDARSLYLGTDNIIGGQELGKAAAGLRPDGGKYATFVGLKSAANAIERIDGFAQGAGDKWKSLDSLGDDMDHSVAQKNVKTALANHPEIDTLVGIWAYNAHAIVQVVSDQGIAEKTTVVVFDAAPKALKHMEDGKIDAMVVQNPYQMGYEGTRLMKALIEDDSATVEKIKKQYAEEGEEDVLITELRVVVPSGDSPLKKEMFAEKTKFFTYDEFKAWLDERNLKGS